LLGRLASTAVAARSATVSAVILLIVAGSIKSRKVLSNRMGYLRPCNWLVAGCPLLLVYIRLDQAGIDRERFAANKPGRDAVWPKN
jgi:hypothetical protein